MKKMIKNMRKRIKDEAGQALVIVLLLLALGSLIIAPLLSYTGTGLTAGQVYDTKSDEFYAADAGVEDALWNITNDKLREKFGEYPYDADGYDPYHYYDYDGMGWAYDLSEQVNGKDVNVVIKNMWVPYGIDVPDEGEAREIIQGYTDEYGVEHPAKLIVTGNAPVGEDYEIKITFLPDAGEESSLLIQAVGIWLPPGYTYGDGDDETPDSIFETDAAAAEGYYSEPQTYSHAGGTAIVWYFSNYPFVGDVGAGLAPFPGVSAGATERSTVTFKYSSESEEQLEAVAWVETTGVGDVSYAWDADVKVYGIHSTATSPEAGTDTEIDAYTVLGEMRELVGATSGDYYATGDAFLYAAGGPLSAPKYRDTMYSSGDATVDSVAAVEDYNPLEGIPSNASIVYAYLYWTGWIDNDGYTDSGGTLIWSDTCDAFTYWDRNDSDGSQTSVPTADGTTIGTWNYSPYWSKVDETTPVDSDYITGVDTGGGSQTQTVVPTGDGDINGTWTAGDITTDWLSPTANAADTGGDNNGFEVSPTNAYGDDSSYARNMDNDNGDINNGDRHRYYGYDVSSIPAGSTILGIEVRLDWWLDSTYGTNSMSVELSWDGGTSWTSAQTDSSESTLTSHSTTLGGPSHTWGHTWTVAQLSNLVVRLTCNSQYNSRDFY